MPSDDLRRALRPFGWVCGPGFERRYHSDPWVFNLANAIEKLTARAERAETERDAARSVIRGVLTVCRECRDEMPLFATNVPQADFIIWGKLASPEALGPRCYDHAVKHLGNSLPHRADQYAVVDLRPLRAALETPAEVAEIHAATNQPGDEEEADVPPEVRDYQPGEQT